jgi:trimeric autotransporter adhesin
MKHSIYIVFAALFASLFSVGANAQTITRFAGGDTLGGYGGDGGPATAALMNQPIALARDAAGNIYIGEGNGNRVRKVNTPGIITTIAGTGTSGYFGDGGQATAAQLNGPDGITFDAAGNMFIADFGSNCIRKITMSTGIITTIAGIGGTGGSMGDGGPATAALFFHPRDVRFDAAGNLYICDWSNHKIRKINTSGIITTIAGTGTSGYTGDGGAATAAAISFPYRAVFNPSGDLFFIDGGNNCVRKIAMSTGNISTVAGSATAGFAGDGGPATAAQFSYLTALVFDIAGNMYIADRGNGRIRKVKVSDGTIQTVVGNGCVAESGDGGPATAAALNKPFDLIFDALNQLYIADINGNTIRKVTADPALGTQPVATANDRVLIPNPNNGTFQVKGNWTTGPGEKVVIMITSVLGQTLYKSATEVYGATIDQPITLNNMLPAGLYFLQVRSSANAVAVPFIVK